MLVLHFSNNPNILRSVGKLPEQRLNVWLLSNPWDKILTLVKLYEAWISECNLHCHIKLYIFNYYYFSIITGQLPNIYSFWCYYSNIFLVRWVCPPSNLLTYPVYSGLFHNHLCHYLIHLLTHPFSLNLQNFQTVWVRKMTFFLNVDQPLSVTFHMSHGTWHMSHVKCHVSHVMGHVFCVCFL